MRMCAQKSCLCDWLLAMLSLVSGCNLTLWACVHMRICSREHNIKKYDHATTTTIGETTSRLVKCHEEIIFHNLISNDKSMLSMLPFIWKLTCFCKLVAMVCKHRSSPVVLQIIATSLQTQRGEEWHAWQKPITDEVAGIFSFWRKYRSYSDPLPPFSVRPWRFPMSRRDSTRESEYWGLYLM